MTTDELLHLGSLMQAIESAARDGGFIYQGSVQIRTEPEPQDDETTWPVIATLWFNGGQTVQATTA